MSRESDEALAELLNRQHETVDPDALAALEERVGDYARGEPWRDEDVALVWTSPEARRLFLEARRKVMAEIEDRWSEMSFDRQFWRRAADAEGEQDLVLGGAGVTIRILRAPGSGDWVVSIALSPEALELIPAGTRIRLRDSGGLQWLSGEPDRDGGWDEIWELDESPIERLRHHSLTLGFG